MQGTAAGHGCDPSGLAVRFIALQPHLFCAACGVVFGSAQDAGDMAFA